MSDKRDRHDRIVDVLARNAIRSQDELLDLLLAEGVRVTQSTLSRDLRELGVVKSEEGYRLPEGRGLREGALDDLAREIAERAAGFDGAGQMVVVRVADPAAAADVAARIESRGLYQIVAALPSATAVLVVARSAAHGRELMRALRRGARPAATSPLRWLRGS